LIDDRADPAALERVFEMSRIRRLEDAMARPEWMNEDAWVERMVAEKE
jgi:hypothetical protein